MKSKFDPNKKILSLDYFKNNLWVEFARYDMEGNLMKPTVTCTEENYQNLYNSQFKDKTEYGEVYRYIGGMLYEKQPEKHER